MRKRCWFTPLLLLGLATAPLTSQAADGCKQLTATGNPEYPPYLWRDRHNPQVLIGANADLLKRLAAELGLEIKLQYAGPWSRAQEEVRNGSIDMVAGYFRTTAREADFDFLSPPFLETASVVWVRVGEAFAYAGWDDLRGHSGGTLVNNSYGQQFDDYAKNNLRLEQVPGAKQAFEKLLKKRNDYVIYEHYPGLAMAKAERIDSKVQILEPPVSSEGLYLAMSQNSSCNQPELRRQLAQKMSELVASSLPRELLEQNLERWESQQAEAAAKP